MDKTNKHRGQSVEETIQRVLQHISEDDANALRPKLEGLAQNTYWAPMLKWSNLRLILTRHFKDRTDASAQAARDCLSEPELK